MEYKDIFVKVIVHSLKELTRMDFMHEELESVKKYVSSKEITSQISIFGNEHEGMLIINLDRNLLKKLYFGIEEEEFEDEDNFTIEDFCGELTNIIAGKFIDFLDLDVTISLPMINFEPVEYAMIRKNVFDCFRFYNNQGLDFFIYTYLSGLAKDF